MPNFSSEGGFDYVVVVSAHALSVICPANNISGRSGGGERRQKKAAAVGMGQNCPNILPGLSSLLKRASFAAAREKERMKKLDLISSHIYYLVVHRNNLLGL